MRFVRNSMVSWRSPETSIVASLPSASHSESALRPINYTDDREIEDRGHLSPRPHGLATGVNIEDCCGWASFGARPGHPVSCRVRCAISAASNGSNMADRHAARRFSLYFAAHWLQCWSRGNSGHEQMGFFCWVCLSELLEKSRRGRVGGRA